MALTNLKAPFPKNMIDLLANALNKITSITWGNITGTLSNQTDLQNALNAKQNTLSLTTNNTSGAATLVGSTLNVPNYTPAWGQITGTLSSQTDLQNALNAKENSITTLAVTKGGTGTSTQFTQGSVVFSGASGVYAQDNANLFWDDSNNRLGVGLNTGLDSNLTVEGNNNNTFDTSLAVKNSDSNNILRTTNNGYVVIGNDTGFGTSLYSGNGTTSTMSINPSNNKNLILQSAVSSVANGRSFIFKSQGALDASNSTGTFLSLDVDYTNTNSTNNSFVALELNPNINQVGGTGTHRSLYINPTITSQNTTHIALETTVGEVIIGSTNGKLKIGNQTQFAHTGEFGFSGTTPSAAQTGWGVSNPVTNRALDVSTATLTQVTQVLGTLIDDLKAKGIITT